MNIFRRQPGGDRGFTLIELLVATALMLIILPLIGGLVVTLTRTSSTVTALQSTTGAAQLVLKSVQTGIRNSSDFRLTNPTGNDQLLVGRTAQNGPTITWVCTAWYYSATDNSLRYTVSPTAISVAPTATELQGWTLLDSVVSPASGTGIFSITGGKLNLAFTSSPGGSHPPQMINTSVYNRAGSTGSPQCY